MKFKTYESMIEESVVVKEETPKVLLEFLFYGLEENKVAINNKMQKLQGLMAKSKKASFLRILFYMDRGEATEQEKKDWLIENSNCFYYIFVGEKESLNEDFVKDRLKHIKNMEIAVKNFKKVNLNRKKK
jgi:hypothetical protein